jgi:hypothetical protein
MTKIYNEHLKKTSSGDVLPFGGKKMVFLGDPAPLRPVSSAAIYDQKNTSASSVESQKIRSCKVTGQYLQRTMRGQELYQKYLEPNSVCLCKGMRNSGLLQEICDHLRNGTQTEDHLQKLIYQRQQFPDLSTDYGVHYDNESCSSFNWRQLWHDCRAESPQRRLYIC